MPVLGRPRAVSMCSSEKADDLTSVASPRNGCDASQMTEHANMLWVDKNGLDDRAGGAHATRASSTLAASLIHSIATQSSPITALSSLLQPGVTRSVALDASWGNAHNPSQLGSVPERAQAELNDLADDFDRSDLPSQLTVDSIATLEHLSTLSRRRRGGASATIDLGGRVLSSVATKPHYLPQLAQLLRTYGEKETRYGAWELHLGTRGTTICNCTLLVPAGFNLCIDSPDVTLRNVTITGTGDAHSWGTRSHLYVERRAANVLFQNVTFQACKLEVARSANARLARCHLSDADIALVARGPLRSSDPCTSVHAFDCTFEACLQHCVHAVGGAVVSLVRCAANSAVHGSGLCVATRSRARAVGCVFRGNCEHGVHVKGFRSRVSLEDCVVEENGKRNTRSGLFSSVSRSSQGALRSATTCTSFGSSSIDGKKSGSLSRGASSCGACTPSDSRGLVPSRPGPAWERLYAPIVGSAPASDPPIAVC